MTLVEHLRELRTRMIRSAWAILIGSIIAWFFYQRIFAFLTKPLLDAAKLLSAAAGPGAPVLERCRRRVQPPVKLSVAVGAILAAPVWLYELFRFVAPGMLRREKRWGALFVLASLPLFLLGVVTAYFALPRLLHALLGFTPQGLTNLTTVDDYISFLIQLVFFFGIGFITPVLVVTLNVLGLLSASACDRGGVGSCS